MNRLERGYRISVSTIILGSIAIFIFTFTEMSLKASLPAGYIGEAAAWLGAVATTMTFIGSISGSVLVSWAMAK